jgi:hypothetical protein
MNTLTLDPQMLAVIGQYMVLGLGMLVAAFVRSHIKNQGTADTLDRILLNAVNFGFNMVPGALKGKSISVDLGSSVAAHALKYALDVGAKEAGALNLDAPDIAKRLLARIPGIDGQMSAGIVHDVVAAAQGHPPPLDPAAVLASLPADVTAALHAALDGVIAARSAPSLQPQGRQAVA